MRNLETRRQLTSGASGRRLVVAAIRLSKIWRAVAQVSFDALALRGARGEDQVSVRLPSLWIRIAKRSQLQVWTGLGARKPVWAWHGWNFGRRNEGVPRGPGVRPTSGPEDSPFFFIRHGRLAG